MPPCHAARPAAAPREKTFTILLCSLIATVGLVAILWLWFHLEAGRRTGMKQWADETVREHTQAAEGHLAKREWAPAIDHLEQALAIPHATDLASVQDLLARARTDQAEALLESALAAIQHRQLDQARACLRDYVAHPLAGQKDRARLLQDELAQAASDEMAAALLKKLSTTALAAFVQDGLTTAVDQLRHEPLRPIYRETLEKNLVREQERREAEEQELLAQREAARRTTDEETRRRLVKRLLEEQRVKKDRDRQLERLRATPVYRELTEYLALVRKQDRQYRRPNEADDRRLLATLLAGPDKLGQEQRSKFLEDLRQRLARSKPRAAFAQWKDQAEATVSSKRALFKERFRTYAGFAKADWELFEKIVDQELDQLLAEIQQPFDDDLVLGLWAVLGKD